MKTAWLLLAALQMLVAGCATLSQSPSIAIGARDPEACAFFAALDASVRRQKVVDASRFAVPGFPYLAGNRFMEALKDRLTGQEVQLAWLKRMHHLEIRSRQKEIANLPPAAIDQLAAEFGLTKDRGAVFDQTRRYSNRLLADDLKRPDLIEHVKKALKIPDEYSTARRIVGIYPLPGFVVSIVSYFAFEKHKRWFAEPPAAFDIEGRLEASGPHHANARLSPDDIKRFFAPANRDALQLPQLSDQDMLSLVHHFAPVFVQDINGDFDRFGKLVWRRNKVSVDADKATVYYYTSHGLLGKQPALQLNYALWFSERTGRRTPLIERGPLDGLTIRITLDNNGRPVMTDIMNSCGCYHFFLPDEQRVQQIIVKPRQFEPLVPAWLPDDFPEKRIELWINSGWHQVQRVSTKMKPNTANTYDLLPYERLESLPKTDGTQESVFTSRGIMKNSWRIEPLIFFSMGIPDVGYMRQRGHHAIQLVGREHFTNPALFNRNFVFKQ